MLKASAFFFAMGDETVSAKLEGRNVQAPVTCFPASWRGKAGSGRSEMGSTWRNVSTADAR